MHTGGLELCGAGDMLPHRGEKMMKLINYYVQQSINDDKLPRAAKHGLLSLSLLFRFVFALLMTLPTCHPMHDISSGRRGMQPGKNLLLPPTGIDLMDAEKSAV